MSRRRWVLGAIGWFCLACIAAALILALAMRASSQTTQLNVIEGLAPYRLLFIAAVAGLWGPICRWLWGKNAAQAIIHYRWHVAVVMLVFELVFVLRLPQKTLGIN